MSLIARLKAVLGVGSSRHGTGGTPVRVEQEADAESERAVKEPTAEFDVDQADEADTPAGRSQEPVDSLTGIGPAYSERLRDAGIETVGDLAAADASTLDAETGIGEGRIEGWIERARTR